MKKLLNWIGEAVDKLLLGYMTKTGLVLWDSGGGSAPAQPTQTTQTTSNIPDWAIPYATQNLGKAQSLTDINQNPYQQYQDQRVADFNPLQQQAMTNIGGMQTNQATQAGIDTAANAAQQAGQYQNYNPQQFGNQYQGQNFQSMGLGSLSTSAPSLNQYQMSQPGNISGNNVGNQNISAAQSGYNPNLQNYQMGPAQQVQNQGLNQYQMGPAQQVRSQNFGAQSAQDYMSPYAQQAIDPTLRENQRQFDVATTGRQAAATRSGAFGGSRQAIEQSEAQRNLGTLQSNTQAQGMQNAYQNAQQQFNADQARRLQAQQSNQQAGLTTGQANLGSALQTQGLGAQQNLQSQLANQQAGLTTGQANLSSSNQNQALGAGQNMQMALANMSNQQQASIQNAANNLQAQGMNAQQAMQAAMANQGMQFNTGQQNLNSLNQTQALGAGQNLQSQQLNQAAQLQAQGQGLQQNLASNQQGMQNAQLGAQYGLAGQQAGEQSRQFGANLGLQGLQQQLSAAGMMGNLGQNQYTQAMGINSAQQQAGAQQQAQAQQGLSNSYQDFLNQQNYPYKQLGFMSDITRGVPTSGGSSAMYQAPPSLTSQSVGMLGGLGSLAGAYTSAARP